MTEQRVIERLPTLLPANAIAWLVVAMEWGQLLPLLTPAPAIRIKRLIIVLRAETRAAC